VVADESGRALGLVFSNRESLAAALDERRGIYWSRSRGELWRKGESSGDVQELLAVDLDCDADALRFTVRQHGRGFCHLGRRTCWGDPRGLPALERTLEERTRSAPKGSYTRRLLDEEGLLEAKLTEEAAELAQAEGHAEVIHEAADLLYFASVAMARGGVTLAEVERELDRRSLKVTRRRGDAKEKA
jgi:phosphoribosyl-ATP pyrophosphohydrolase